MARDEVDRLRARVNVVERWRHVVAVAAATFSGSAILSAFDEGFDIDWSPLSVILLFTVLGAVVWWVVECTLAGVMAIWETRMFGLVRDRELPVARLLRR